ncbi:Guanylate kinase [Cucumispora dikerogammari]|nr:Guanylate kinase [Cucumispora dikerogammari]
MSEITNNKILVINGSSGCGKTTLIHKLVINYKSLQYIKSFTTRERRTCLETDYIFLTHEEFLNKIENNELLEYEVYCNNFYGTPNFLTTGGVITSDNNNSINNTSNNNSISNTSNAPHRPHPPTQAVTSNNNTSNNNNKTNNYILDIGRNGVKNLLKFKNKHLNVKWYFLFINVNITQLTNRLYKRTLNDLPSEFVEDFVKDRLESYEKDQVLKNAGVFDFVIENDVFDDCYNELVSILKELDMI